MTKEDLKNISDEELVERYRNSHETVYIGELYLRYTALVYGVCMKYFRNSAEAEDGTMQIFEKLITDLKKHHITAFKPWLHTVVKNFCMMEFRKQNKQGQLHNNLKAEAKNSVENPEVNHLQEAEDKEFVLTYLKEGIDELNTEQRECIELFYLKDCSYQEVSNITGHDLKSVKSYIQNGKRNLRIFITKQNEQAKKE